ncbi:MAG: SRPBCC domain-containing protein [Myxococcales bacterium]|nr:SRPBCC domain-containing protein [Myxococcales bacterium]HQY61609.1 SRPBCC domain-containing protein [Polyangiaceae bacterium]
MATKKKASKATRATRAPKASPARAKEKVSPAAPPGVALRLTAELAAPPVRVFDAWMSGEGHAAFTGAGATVEARVGGRHTAWDGYIEGTTVEVARPDRIVQTWRTSEFPAAAPDSRIELSFRPSAIGTELTLVHTGIPRGQGAKYRRGWEEHYFSLMRAHFGRGSS